jgi:DNA repair protein RAD57
MSDILQILPHFSTVLFSHLLPSLDKASVTTADLLCTQPVDIARRAQIPSNEVAKLINALIESLHDDVEENKLPSWTCISLLDDGLDEALGGGFPVGYVTEVTGERYNSNHISKVSIF